MMRKFLAVFLVVALMTTNGLLIGCGEQVGEAKDLEVELSWVDPAFAGMESICLTPIWTIKNPNNFMVTVEAFDYVLRGEGMVVGRAEIGDIYIPANAEVEISDICVVEVTDPIKKCIFAGTDGMKVWAEESGVPGIIALVGGILGMAEQLNGMMAALAGASMAAEAAAAGKDVEAAAAKLRATSDQLSAILNSDSMAGMLGPGAGDKLAAAADHAEAADAAALEEDAKALKGMEGVLKATIAKLAGQAAPVAAAMPKWKALGGKLPSTMHTLLAPDDLKGAWEAIPDKAAFFESEGKISTSSAAGDKEMTFSGLTWTTGTAE